MVKKCPTCGKIKYLEEFYTNRARYDGIASHCKECSSIRNRIEYEKTQKEKICKICSKIFIGRKNKMVCSAVCAGTKKRKGITGYKKCLWCEKEFAFRDTLKVRGSGKIASIKQRFCSLGCALIFRNKSVEQKEAVSKKLKGRPSPQKGKKLSLETRERMSNSFKGRKSHFWRGGVTPLQNLIRRHYKSTIWKKEILNRDNYTCQICREKGGILQIDHYPKSFSEIFHRNKITSIIEAIKCEEFWNINNGRTLCVDCHKETPTYLKNDFTKIINTPPNKT